MITTVALAMLIANSTLPDANGHLSSRGFGVEISKNASESEVSSQKASTNHGHRDLAYVVSEPICSTLVLESDSCNGAARISIPSCDDGADSVTYVFRTYSSTTGELISTTTRQVSCNSLPDESARRPLIITETDFRALNLEGSPVTITPNGGDLYVNLPIFMNTTAEPQTLTTQLLATPVTIRATPKEFEWSYGDTTTKTGTTPGSTYPDETYAHTYTTPGIYTVTLTTTWSGEYSTNNGETWTPIDGTATTTSTTNPLTVQESIPILTK